MQQCPLCSGSGGWSNEKIQQSILCPLCRSAKKSAIDIDQSPDWLDGYNRMPAKYFGPIFGYPPDLIIVHRASTGRNVAEYFANPGDDRKVSAHFAWSDKYDGYCQCVSLHREAYHAGGSIWGNDKRLNDNSIGFELPGKMNTPLSNHEKSRCRGLLLALYHALPSIKAIIGHSDGDPPNRRDPGKEFPWGEMIKDLNWKCPHLI